MTLSWTINPKRLEETEALIEEGWQQGYRNFNIKVAPDPALDIELAQIVRARRPERFSVGRRQLRLRSDNRPGMRPPPGGCRRGSAGVASSPESLSGYQALKKQGALPILMDEGIVSPIGLEEFIRLNMLDGIAVKPARSSRT